MDDKTTYMEWGIIILLVTFLSYQIGHRRGYKKGEKLRDFKLLNEGFRNGRKSFKEELCEMKGLSDDEILKRIKNFIKNCKD